MKKMFLACMVISFLTACTKNDSLPNGITVSIGDSLQGGIVAYILQSGDIGYDTHVQHGIIAAPEDYATKLTWYNGTFNLIGGTSTLIGTGASNTKKIIQSQGTSGLSAAQLSLHADYGGYTDWYLPSRDELNQLYLNKTKIGGFQNSYYWSSSEYSAKVAWSLWFSTGAFDNTSYYKGMTMQVRLVRSF